MPDPPPVEVRNTALHRLTSPFINQEYCLFVQTPPNYAAAGRRFPVIYLLDGDQYFGLVTDAVRLLQFARAIPPVITVGIGYGSDAGEHFDRRIRDLSPTPAEGFLTSGGGPAFFRFLQEEVIPFINQNYPTLRRQNSLVGASMGGLFALYALMEDPGLFRRYLVSSPALLWAGGWILEQVANFVAESRALPVRLFLAVGGLEPDEVKEAVQTLIRTLQSGNLAGLELAVTEFGGENHFSVQAAAVMRGLESIFY